MRCEPDGLGALEFALRFDHVVRVVEDDAIAALARTDTTNRGGEH
jgi:hypothetical protein